MKKFASLFALVMAVALTGPVHAQKMSGSKPPAGKMTTTTAAAKTQSFTGTLTGAPTGKTFSLGMKKGPMTVDATKAKVRMNGKFASLSSLKSGTSVTVVGKMSGTSFMADTVTAKSAAAPKMGGMTTPKMAPKMTAKPKM